MDEVLRDKAELATLGLRTDLKGTATEARGWPALHGSTTVSRGLASSVGAQASSVDANWVCGKPSWSEHRVSDHSSRPL